MKYKIPPYVSRLFPDYTGFDILEFGNKKTPEGFCYRDEYLANGAKSYTSVDINAEDGAIPIDLRLNDAAKKIQEKSGHQNFDMITNIGTSEHVTVQRTFWKCVHELCKPGTVIIHWVPQAEKRLDHAAAGSCWHPYPEFFDKLAEANNYKIDFFELTPPYNKLPYGNVGWDLNICRYIVEDKLEEFVWNDELESLFWRNPKYDESKWVYKI